MTYICTEPYGGRPHRVPAQFQVYIVVDNVPRRPSREVCAMHLGKAIIELSDQANPSRISRVVQVRTLHEENDHDH